MALQEEGSRLKALRWGVCLGGQAPPGGHRGLQLSVSTETDTPAAMHTHPNAHIISANAKL